MIERKRLARRMLTALAAALVLTLALAGVVGSVLAQGDSPRKLNVGQTVTGSLNEQNFAQVFLFDGQADSSVTLTASSTTSGLTLALLLTDANGQTIARAANVGGADVSLENVRLPASGSYFVTVLRSTGAQGQAAGQFSLTLTQAGGAVPTATPQTTVNLPQGLSFALTWASIDDMDLEVRDPVGGSVFFRTVSVESGGRLSANVNNGCTNTVETPTETINWPQGNVPAGSYEILVYYNQACRQPAQANDFTVTITVNGQQQQAIQGRLNLNEQYVASVIVEGPSQVTVNQGGANPLFLDLRSLSGEINNPTALNGLTQAQGRIDRNNPADTWSFDATANQIISISMDALDGSLDPQLILLGPDKNVIASNDDASDSSRNSLISNQILPTAGTYTIVATRFGKDIGGTEGRYVLNLAPTGSPIAAATAAPGAGTLVPTAVAGTGPTPTPAVAATNTTGLQPGSIQITLVWDNRADVRLLVRDPANRSLFSDNTQVPNGGILARQDNLNCTNTVPQPFTYAYWPQARPATGTYEVQVWMNDQCDEPVPPNYTLTVTVNGQEVITHRDQPDINRNLYVITFTVDANGGATAGQGGIFAQDVAIDIGDISAQLAGAPALTYGQSRTGAIDAANTYAVFTFQARAGDRVRITMRTTRGNLDPFLYLLDATGAQIARNDDISGTDRNSQIDQVIGADGAYVIVATRFGANFGGTAGNFELSVAPLR